MAAYDPMQTTPRQIAVIHRDIVETKARHPEMTCRQIAAATGVSRETVRKVVKRSAPDNPVDSADEQGIPKGTPQAEQAVIVFEWLKTQPQDHRSHAAVNEHFGRKLHTHVYREARIKMADAGEPMPISVTGGRPRYGEEKTSRRPPRDVTDSISTAVESLAGIGKGIELMRDQIEAIDTSQIDAWLETLEAPFKTLAWLRKTLKEKNRGNK